jgi:hypothetical protein
VRHITSSPSGFEVAGTKEFRLYLPGYKLSNLPEGFLIWVDWAFPEGMPTKLPSYGLYNIDGSCGFY